MQNEKNLKVITTHDKNNNFNNHFRWLKGLHIHAASEAKQRAIAKDVVGDNIVAEWGAFTFQRVNRSSHNSLTSFDTLLSAHQQGSLSTV